jgi:hypothetical protein
MNVPEVKPIELTPEEAALRQQMEAEVSGQPVFGQNQPR